MDIELNMRSILTAVFKHQFKIIAVFALIMTFGVMYIVGQQSSFAARASFLVKFGQGAVPNVSSDMTLRPTELSYSDRNELMQSYLNIIQSSDLVSRAIDKVGFDKVFATPKSAPKASLKKERLVESFIQSNVTTSIVDRSNIIELKVSHKDPKIAFQLAEAVLNGFMEKQAEIYNTSPSEFLQQRLDEAARQRDAAQNAFSAFKKENNITDIDSEIDQLLQEKREMSNISFGSTASNQTTIANLITELQTKKAELEATYRPDSIVLKKVNDSLKVARSQQKAGGTGANFSSRGISVDQRVAEIDDRISFLETNRGVFNEFKQDAVVAEDRAKYFKQRVEDARLNQALNQENISRITVIDKPVIPNDATGKNKKLLLIAFLMLSVFCSMALILISEFLDDRVSTPEQLEHISAVPVIGSFSHSELK